jgi:hypothetical protein
MNYLTHFLIDHRPEEPYYNFGLALPDLVSISKRGWKPVSTDELLNGNPHAAKIWEGFQQHLKADAEFHNTELFNYHTRRLRKELEKAGLSQPGIRLFFVAHVLLEILIDRHIVKTRRHVPDLFYKHLGIIEDPQIKIFFEASGTETPERFLEFFGKFKDSQYLYGYEEDNGIYYSINRLLRRTNQPMFETEAQNRAFIELIRREEAGMFEEVETFLQHKKFEI